MLAVDSHKVDAFAMDENILKYLVKSEFPGRVQVIGGTFDEYFVSIALQQSSRLRKPINKALLKERRRKMRPKDLKVCIGIGLLLLLGKAIGSKLEL